MSELAVKLLRRKPQNQQVNNVYEMALEETILTLSKNNQLVNGSVSPVFSEKLIDDGTSEEGNAVVWATGAPSTVSSVWLPFAAVLRLKVKLWIN